MDVKLPPSPRLEGKSLALRKVRPWDCWSLYRNLHTPEVRQFESGEFVGASKTAQHGVLHRFRHLAYLFKRGLRALGINICGDRKLDGYRLAVVPTDVKKAIGIVSLTEINVAEKHADIGILLGKDYWGRGFMIEAESLLLQWAFESLKFDRIFANVNSENVASYITMKKLGFQRDRTLRQFTDARGRAVEMIRVVVSRESFRGL